MGVNVGRTRIVAYVLCAVFASLAAVMLAVQIGTGDATAGQNYTLQSIAVVVLGGASIYGGRGSFVGTVLGALLLTEMINAITFLELSDAWQYWFPGAVILIAAGDLRPGQPHPPRRGGLGGRVNAVKLQLTEMVPDRETSVALYRRMRLIRGFEELIQQLFMKGDVPGTTHLYIGEEAGAVGVADVLGEGDRVAGTYRGHGHALALGVDPQALLDEMLGRSTGVCGGRAGSMNVIDLSNRLIGCFGIIGGSIGAATGAALSLRRSGGVAVAFFGEGTTNHGYFHECLNMAQVMSLPVLFVCENNRYGEFTPFEDVTAGSILERPRTLGIESEQVDGMDVFAVRDAARRAVERAREGGGPQFLETLTYRFVGHSRSDPGPLPQGGRAGGVEAARPADRRPRTARRVPRRRRRRARRRSTPRSPPSWSRCGPTAWRRRCPIRDCWPQPRSSSLERDRHRRGADHAPALRLDGGGDGAALDEAGGRAGRGRRGDRRDRDRQGQHGV